MTFLRVLVVEDEVAIAILIEDAVESFGHIVSHTATNIKTAMNTAITGDFDVALIDLNLNGQRAHALPTALTARGKPFGFITGYGADGVLLPFAKAPLLAKPFRVEDIGEMLEVLQKQI